MSRVADIILVVAYGDDKVVEDLTFWMGTEQALDQETVRPVQDVAAALGSGTDAQAPANRVGNLLPLTGAIGEELWGGQKALNFSAWGAVTSNMDWERFLAKVESAPWLDHDRVQLLMKDDGDTYFRLYMFDDGELRNVVPAPRNEGYDRDW